MSDSYIGGYITVTPTVAGDMLAGTPFALYFGSIDDVQHTSDIAVVTVDGNGYSTIEPTHPEGTGDPDALVDTVAALIAVLGDGYTYDGSLDVEGENIDGYFRVRVLLRPDDAGRLTWTAVRENADLVYPDGFTNDAGETAAEFVAGLPDAERAALARALADAESAKNGRDVRPFTFSRDAARAWLAAPHPEYTDQAYGDAAFGIDADWGDGSQYDMNMGELGDVIANAPASVLTKADGWDVATDVLQDDDDPHYIVTVTTPTGLKLTGGAKGTRHLICAGIHDDAGWPGLERLLDALEDVVSAANTEAGKLAAYGAALSDVESKKNRAAIAQLVRAQIATEFDAPDAVTAVVFRSWEWDNGYVINRNGAAFYEDGTRAGDFEADDDLIYLLAGECGGVGEQFAVGVDLRTGELHADTYGHDVYEALRLQVPAHL